jgi:hypothetical protein
LETISALRKILSVLTARSQWSHWGVWQLVTAINDAVDVLMFSEYYLQGHNGTHSCLCSALAGHNNCLVTLCFFEVSLCNHIHMTFVIYTTKAYSL